MAKGARVLFLTGKGGVGKSFLARHLACKLAELTGRVALLPLGRPGTADDAGSPVSLAHEEEVESVVFDERAALADLLTRILGFRFLSERLLDSRTFNAVIAAVPGLREFMTVAFIESLAARERYRWVVVDAPASGHALALLAAPQRMARIAPFGPAARLARASADFVTDPNRLRAVIVATPEELAAREAVETDARMREIGVVPRHIVINGMYPEFATGAAADWLERQSHNRDALLYLTRWRRQRAIVAELIREFGAIEVVPRTLPNAEPADHALADFAARLAGGA